MTERQKRWLTGGAALVTVAVALALGWQKYRADGEGDGLARGNGRIEAVEIAIAAKSPGRIKEILVREGEFVTAGQVVAVIDSENLAAQLRQAEAQLQQAYSTVATAQSQLAQRESERGATTATIRQREAELLRARQHAERSAELARERAIAQQNADDDSTQLLIAESALHSARAQLAASEAAIMTVRTQIVGAESAVTAAKANIERIRADIADSELKSPRDGRVQYRVAQPGEVVGAGGRVLNLVDLSDVYMTFFLPTAAAGKVAYGSEVRIVLDAAPQYVLPAQVSFIADVAQFTPKTVETLSEREKLMFRIRAQLPADLLTKHITRIKTGLPGVAYVRLDAARPWPEHLQVKLPQ